MAKKLFTIQEAERELGVGRGMINNHIRLNNIKATVVIKPRLVRHVTFVMKPKKQVRIPEDELVLFKTWLDSPNRVYHFAKWRKEFEKSKRKKVAATG
jgi:hypothetical protein